MCNVYRPVSLKLDYNTIPNIQHAINHCSLELLNATVNMYVGPFRLFFYIPFNHRHNLSWRYQKNQKTTKNHLIEDLFYIQKIIFFNNFETEKLYPYKICFHEFLGNTCLGPLLICGQGTLYLYLVHEKLASGLEVSKVSATRVVSFVNISPEFSFLQAAPHVMCNSKYNWLWLNWEREAAEGASVFYCQEKRL